MARLQSQVRMPAERRAQFRVPDVPRSQMSKPIHSEFMNTPNVEFLNVPLCSAPMSYRATCQQQMWSSTMLRACRNALVLAAWMVVSCPYLRYGDRGRLQNVSRPSVLVESSQFFMVALWNRADHYIFMLWFVLLLSFFFFPRLISAAADWMSAILPHMVWP